MSFVRFPLGSVPDVAALTDAKLELESIFQSCTGGCSLQLYGLDDGTAGEDWVENSIIYNNAPTIPGDSDGTTQDLDTTNLTLLDTFEVANSPNGPNIPPLISTNWTPEMLAFLQADTDGQVTFVIYMSDAANRNVHFASKEHATLMVPILTVTDVGLLSTCGDSIVEGNEQCDGGGAGDGDGCSSTCQYETGPCDDGLFCTTGEAWSSGVCGGGGTTDCSASTDQCNASTFNDQCAVGVCQGTVATFPAASIPVRALLAAVLLASGMMLIRFRRRG